MSFTEKKKQTPIVKINKNVYAGKTRQRLQILTTTGNDEHRLNPTGPKHPTLNSTQSDQHSAASAPTHLPPSSVMISTAHGKFFTQWHDLFAGPIHNIPIHHPISLQDDVIKIAWSRIRSHFSAPCQRLQLSRDTRRQGVVYGFVSRDYEER
ncbi:hypothetical protein NC652_020503 [Populus alba x Populus x berolinensis]|nr:hypothetical protein NC652_020503 [Populus alba x Populus x berolinensis]